MGRKGREVDTLETRRSYRVMHRFWLDITQPTEYDLDQEIGKLKAQKKFAGAIRDGLRLIIDLSAGKMDVLFELFPWTQERLTTSTPAQDFDSMVRELAAMRRAMESGGGGMVLPMSSLEVMEMDTKPFIIDEPDIGAEESRLNFAASLGGLFDDDDEVGV